MTKFKSLLAIIVMATMAVACNKPDKGTIGNNDGANGGDISNYDIYEEFKTA